MINAYNVRIDFTRLGRRRFSEMNRVRGSRFIDGFVLRRELAEYIAAYDASGARLDTVCQELRYEDGVHLLMMKCHGVWYITDVWSTDAPVTFAPVFFWKRIKQGCKELLAHVLIGWSLAKTSAIAWSDAGLPMMV